MKVEYIRNKRRQKIGVMIALKDDMNRMLVGFSKCNTGLDTFNKDTGKRIATNRAIRWAETGECRKCSVPDSVIDPLRDFVQRCQRYYKDTTLPQWIDLRMKKWQHYDA